jgi:hypothetical protein
MAKVVETEEEYVIEIPQKQDFDLLVFTSDYFAQLGLTATVTVKPQEPSAVGSLFSGGGEETNNGETGDLTIPYKWFYKWLMQKSIYENLLTRSEPTNESSESTSRPPNKTLTMDYFTSFLTKKPSTDPPDVKTEDDEEKDLVEKQNNLDSNVAEQDSAPIVEESEVKPAEQTFSGLNATGPMYEVWSEPDTVRSAVVGERLNSVDVVEGVAEREPIVPTSEEPVEEKKDNMIIVIRIQKQQQSKILKLNDQMAELKIKPRTIEDFDETGMNYLLLEKITFDLYRQFEIFAQVNVVPVELNQENIYKLNDVYVYLDNSKLEMKTDEPEILNRQNKELFKKFIDELMFGGSGKMGGMDLIENTKIEKLF